MVDTIIGPFATTFVAGIGAPIFMWLAILSNHIRFAHGRLTAYLATLGTLCAAAVIATVILEPGVSRFLSIVGGLLGLTIGGTIVFFWRRARQAKAA